MCFPRGGGGGGDNSIAQQQLQLAQQQNDQLQAQNAEKKANISAGQQSIENAFAQFDPAYYQKYLTDYTAAQTVPLADQYARAKDSQIANLAGRGIGASSAGNQALADIDQRNGAAIGAITNSAANAANTQRSTIESAKTGLYSLNSAGNDPSGINANAIGSASALVKPKNASPLGNVFADLLTPIGNYYRAATYSGGGFGGTSAAPSALPQGFF